jgi:hypothetical protein
MRYWTVMSHAKDLYHKKPTPRWGQAANTGTSRPSDLSMPLPLLRWDSMERSLVKVKVARPATLPSPNQMNVGPILLGLKPYSTAKIFGKVARRRKSAPLKEAQTRDMTELMGDKKIDHLGWADHGTPHNLTSGEPLIEDGTYLGIPVLS